MVIRIGVMKKMSLIAALLVSVQMCWAQQNGLADRAKVYEPHIVEAATKYKVDPRVLWIIGYLESGFQSNLISSAGARGMMQIMPGTGARYDLRNPFDPVASIHAAARYLNDLQQLFGPRLDQILAAYNSGEATVEAFRTGRKLILSNGKVINPKGLKTPIPPYRETVAYVRNGLQLFTQLKKAGYFEEYELSDLELGPPVVSVELDDAPDELLQLKAGSIYVVQETRSPSTSSSIYPR
jgi:hypothetical protein